MSGIRPAPTRPEELSAIVRDIELAAEEVLSRCTANAMRRSADPDRTAIFLGLYCKAIKITKAVRLLCEARLGQEALGVQRAILEVAATLKLLLDDADRELTRRYYYYCHKIRRTVVLEGQQDTRLALRFDGVDPDYVDDVKNGTIADLGLEAWKSFQHATHWHPDYRQNRPKMFADLGMASAYTAMYRIGSSSLHATDYSMYVEATEDRTLRARSAEPWLALSMGCTADFLLEITGTVAHEFDVDSQPLLSPLRARLAAHVPECFEVE